jgi:hypothetical protein
MFLRAIRNVLKHRMLRKEVVEALELLSIQMSGVKQVSKVLLIDLRLVVRGLKHLKARLFIRITRQVFR